MNVESASRGPDQLVRLRGDLLRGRIGLVEEAVNAALLKKGDVLLDVQDVERFDSAGAEFLVRRLKAAEGRLLLLNARPELRGFLEALPPPEKFKGELTTLVRAPVADFLVDTATEVVERIQDKVRRFLGLFLQFVYFMTIGPFRGHRLRLDRAADETVAVGIDALPIVSLVAMLMGLILGLQSIGQLDRFGGEGFHALSATLVGVAITREIGPLLTAILVAGRSGSAITAEIGTMAVTEELDALRVMGLNPVSFLVVPKILSLVVALPCLVMFGDIVGIGGGFLNGCIIHSVPFSLYWEETQSALELSDVLTGLVKAAVFGLLIGLTGATHGMMVRGGSTEVGLKTTSSVVVSITLVIFFDLIFTMAFILGGM